jgi:hypothetical protein
MQQADTSRAGVNAAPSAASTRGNAALVNAYQTNQRNTYYIVSTPDVDTACRNRIFQCLVEYCGDTTVVPGQRDSRCTSASEGELYNWVLLCLQKDNTALMPNYATGTAQMSGKGMNSAARLCPSYVQQELMSYLSMANMAESLTKQRSDTCVQRRRELEAAMSCHSIALSYGNETANKLKTTLTDFCGEGVPGGSAEMVMKYANAGNVGANIFGWAEKIVSLDLSKKGAEWQSAVDAVLAGYINRMNLACGENMQMQTVTREKDTGPTNLQIAAVMAVGAAFPVEADSTENPYQKSTSLWQEINSLTNVYDFATAKQIVNAGLSNSPTTQNAFLTSATMQSMQSSYMLGVKVFVLRDSARCYIVPVQTLDGKEQSVLGQQFASCIK